MYHMFYCKEWVTFMVKKLCTETSNLPTVWGHSALCHVIILCIIHGAVLLASKLMVAKICDFGIARLLDHKTKATMAGTCAWMAPEVRTIMYVVFVPKLWLYPSSPGDPRSTILQEVWPVLLWYTALGVGDTQVPFEELCGVSYNIQVAIVDGKVYMLQ